MRIVLTVVWALILLIFTCSLNFHMLIHHHIVDFRFNPSPDWLELLKLDFHWSSADWVQRKAGHLVGFFILAVIGSNFGKYRPAFFLSILYAVMTEILQLYFFRGGRIYDALIDSTGVFLAFLGCKFLQYARKDVRSIRNKNKSQ